jgi:AcrR family transcriptional regulator
MRELVARTGIPPATIHYYRAAGLLPEPLRVSANRFLYDERHVEALAAIRALRDRRGLSLRSIGQLLPELVSAGEEQSFRPEAWDMALVEQIDEARERLLQTAISMFSSPGYSQVTMSDIADAAGIAKGSVYRVFTSKDELFLEAVRVCVTEVVLRFNARATEAGAPVDVDTAARILGEAVRPAMPLLMDLAAQTLMGDHDRLEVAHEVLDTLLRGVGPATRGRGSARERAARVLQHVMVDAFRAIVPTDAPV